MLNKKNIFSWLNFFKKKSLNNNNKIINNDNNNSTVNSVLQSIKHTKNNFLFKIKKFFLKNTLNDLFFEKLEEQLLQYDFGVFVSKSIVNNIFKKYKNNVLKDESDIYLELKDSLYKILNKPILNRDIIVKSTQHNPYIILLIGINGVGKTTTAAKLAYFYKNLGKSVALSASDTFRAAAIEQIKAWGDKISIPVFCKQYGTDPSSVIFDSIDFARTNKIDVLIIDTAGRLHSNINLIYELQKNIRVIQKKMSANPNEVLLVLDACNGQNSFTQTELFFQHISNITGIILTKLDGTAKGGIIFSIIEKFSIPIQYFSNGENLSDFYKFDAKDFIESIFS
ncbi:signal recognition particle-docking protein FtsY [Buchnera aphidicola (Takecallis taiwana)]|uniref:signal recognition particle-docking protein FtsY n=1 Tax=Buchnera aphidicola TaxID=9 RepID=UPI0031B72901